MTVTFHSLITALFLLTPTTRALPHPFETAATATAIDSTETPPGGYGPPPASTPTPTVAANSTTSATAPPTTSFPSSSASLSQASFTGRCDYSYCNSGSNVCFYWAGYTSWDVSRGPIPGEVPTILGPC
ncbi:hypothetical protein F5Y00DRAFT_24650 [Daldinia vernicosa]|uniref:uncharacterized protein n=1 Tax=Daldinia vernicosa TaxID=114800 RepID=UPI002008D60D|nr:uncharacterized protein F5Y00DRAFT_24650 [Daldinia vernicosa]KAI0851020.1 hypothetical protein F5Y00DRAFT_24650 [Daldinia vernicosa]